MQNMPSIRKKKTSNSWLCIIGCALLLCGILSLSVIRSDLETMGSPMLVGTNEAKQKLNNKLRAVDRIDVNAPPVGRSGSQTLGFKTEAYHRHADATSPDSKENFLLSWGRKSESSLFATDSGEKLHSDQGGQREIPRSKEYPVVEDREDRVPRAAAGAMAWASDVLLCRKSVVDYVINATDVKDECDGLKKAFTKNCGGDEGPNILSSRRNLQSWKSALSRERPSNPILRLYEYLDVLHGRARKWLKVIFVITPTKPNYGAGFEPTKNHPKIDENALVEQDDFLSFSISPARRQLNEALDFAQAEMTIDAEGDDPTQLSFASPIQEGESSAVKIASEGVKEKPRPPNLSLPTKNVHVSEKMLSETLLLQHEEKIIADVKAASQISTSQPLSAVADAAASTKAVADTAELVSSVLNDPSSVEARTCCASILNVFHENCNIDDEEELSDRRLVIVVAVVGFCGLVKSLIRHFRIRWLPEAAGCIVVGVISGWALSFYPHHDISFDGPWFLRIMVPPIVFEAALSIDKRSFNRHVVPIIFYAILGTLVSTCITAYILHEGSKFYHGHCETIPVIESLAFGSLISSIDPIAVLSVLSNMGMTDTDTIYVVIFGESLLNDGVAIVLFQTLVHFLDANMKVDSKAVLAAAIHFLVVAIGSLLVGLASGICCTIYYWVMHGCQTPLVEVLMFCCWALIPYYVCDGIEWSGIVAVVAAGFVMDVYVVGPHAPREDDEVGKADLKSTKSPRSRRPRAIFAAENHLSKEAKMHIGFVTEIISTMMETSIFAYLGLFLFSSRYHWNQYHTCIAIAACCISRGLMIPALSALANWITKLQQVRARWYQVSPHPELSTDSQKFNAAGVVIDRRMQLVLWFAGLRGAMSFALVENIPLYDAVTGEGTRLKSELKAMTSACIIFTVFILGGSTYYMMETLGMAPSASKKPEASNLLVTEDKLDLDIQDDCFQDHYDDEDQHREDMPLMMNNSGTIGSNTGFRQRNQGY